MDTDSILFKMMTDPLLHKDKGQPQEEVNSDSSQDEAIDHS